MKYLTVLILGVLLVSLVMPCFADEVIVTEEKAVEVTMHQGGGILWRTGEYKNFTTFKLLGTKPYNELPENWTPLVKLLACDISINAGGAYDTTTLQDGVGTLNKRVGSLGDALSSIITVPDWVNRIDLNLAFAGLYCADIFSSDRKFDGITGVDFTGKVIFKF